MAEEKLGEFWKLVERQHGVVTRVQLVELGFTPGKVQRWLAGNRLFPLWRGVYAVGRPVVTREGHWMAATLACGPQAALSHGSAAALWGIGEYERGQVEVSVPAGVMRRQPGIRVRERNFLVEEEAARHESIPLTTPTRTLMDLAPRLGARLLERAVNEAANLDLVDPEALRAEINERKGQRGTKALRLLLDRRSFRLTDSELERRFLPLAERAGLPAPQTQVWLNGFRVDFYWAELGLVVETDGLTYHRTPAQQARDRLRDQAHTAAGLVTLRFTHAQVNYEPGHVVDVLRKVSKHSHRRAV